MDYFDRLASLLKTEQEEDRLQYQQMAASTSIVQRREAGLAWFPIAIRDSELGRGDYLSVEVERTTHQDITHQLRFGAPAALFSNHDPAADRIGGIISWQSGHRLKLTLRMDELPEWAKNGRLGIDLLFDDNSYTEMFAALRQAAALADQREEGRLIRILAGKEPLQPSSILTGKKESPQPSGRVPGDLIMSTHAPAHETPDPLNAAQRAAVDRILSSTDLAIVHGPPGTGKTTTLVEAIAQLVIRDRQQVLVTAPSNTAVDLLSEKLASRGLGVLRVGNPVRVSEGLLSLTLDSKMAAHPDTKEIRRLRKKATEFTNMAHKYKRNFGPAEREQRKALFEEARRIIKDVERLEQAIVNDILGRVQVIAATLVGANHYTVRHLRFGTAFIDEAGQALEPACWIPILKAQRLVLAGDHRQLPPTIKSDTAAGDGLYTTLMEKTAALHPDAVILLEEQYRMNRQIMGYSSQVFYENRLRPHASVANHTLFEGDSPLAFIDTAGCGFEERREGSGITNPEEAGFLVRHAAQLITELRNRFTVEGFPTMAIISPYRQQAMLLGRLVGETPGFRDLHGKIAVNTIDSFQGQERDIVYIGLTRSNPDSRIGFLAEIRRMNVAMTRARKKLVVIGDSATLGRVPFYEGFITYAEKHNAWHSAWEFAFP